MELENTPPMREDRKRARERRIMVAVALAFVLLSFIQAFLTTRRETFGFFNSLLFFGLLHLNVILIMFLVFLVSRNVVKAYLARKSGVLGSSLRWKMITSLLAFSIIPSLLLFVGSSTVIRQGFDRWFGAQVGKALDDAQAISHVHYEGVQTNLAFYAGNLLDKAKILGRRPNVDDLAQWMRVYPTEAIEIYFSTADLPLRLRRNGVPEWAVPQAALDSLERAFRGESFHLIRQYGDGDLVQYFVPYSMADGNYVMVLSHTVPLGLKTRIAELQSAFVDYKRTALFKESLKTNYTLVLFTLFVLILFVVSWFGLYIAKSVTDPVFELLKGTEAFRQGRWNYRIPTVNPVSSQNLASASADLEVLKTAFNLMAEEVGRRGHQLEDANAQLTSLVRELEDREKYLEILLSSIRRGVLVLTPAGQIERANTEALQFAAKEFAVRTHQGLVWVDGVVDPAFGLKGRSWRDVFPGFGSLDDARLWLDEAQQMDGRPVDRIFNVTVYIEGHSRLQSVRATGIWLRENRGPGLGWLIILEDVSDNARLERLAAWQEVARRVAHEIKNPLTPIQISVDRLQRRMGARMVEDSHDGPVFQECVGQIQKQVRVIRDLVREFSQFAKLPEPRFVRADIVQLVGDILEDYRFTHPECDFQISSALVAEAAPWVRADPEYLRRLVVNLADNALHSMEEAKVAKPTFNIHVRLGPLPSFVVIEFTDAGPGVAPDLVDKIFDPYVTSKASGLGLGLPIVRRIAMEHRGRIRCEAGPGGRFILELPLIEDTGVSAV